MKRKSVVVAIAAVGIITGGCGQKPVAETAVVAEKPIVVQTAAVVTREIPADFEANGSFAAEELSNVAPPVAGRVIATPVDVGAHVAAGQIICELDHRDARLRLDQAKAQFQQAVASVRQAQSRLGLAGAAFDANKVPEVAAARANYESAQAQSRWAAADLQRYANLVATGDVSRSSWERAKTAQETADAQSNAAKQQYEATANAARQNFEVISNTQASVDAAQALVSQAEKALADTTIRAPFEGFVTARPVAAGEYVALQDRIATIVRVGTMKLELQVPEQRAAAAHVGDKVIARVAAFNDREFTGTVAAINTAVDPASRAFVIEAHFVNRDNALKPGMFATARILLPGGVQAMFVPKTAVLRDKTTDTSQVFVVDGGKVHMRVVAMNASVNGTEPVRILSGISGSETLAITNVAQLYDGAAITTGGER